jgi:pyridoxal phosphate enzyme (YggS family)
MAVSKFQPVSRIAEAYAAGLRLFGESRVQEACGKLDGRGAAFPGAEFHMIGSLQRNKAKTAAVLFDCVQSVDRDELIAALGKYAAARAAPLAVLLELNAGEASKSGYKTTDALFGAMEAALAWPYLAVRGLMTMAPLSRSSADAARAFAALRTAREALRARFGALELPVLSMGMSGDYKAAIREGSTLLRIGTAIFGEGGA